VAREDIGYGVAHRQITPAKALEIAKKVALLPPAILQTLISLQVAVSDGIKRALRQFGGALGNEILALGAQDQSPRNPH